MVENTLQKNQLSALDKPTYNFFALLSKPKYLNKFHCGMLCNEESSYILHKWKPNHVIYDKCNGNFGKRILKIKEFSTST